MSVKTDLVTKTTAPAPVAPAPTQPAPSYPTPLGASLAQGGTPQGYTGGGRVDPNDPNIPAWIKAGFPDTPDGIASYNQIYGSTGSPGSPFPGSTVPGPAADPNIAGSDPFSQYLAANPGRGDAWAYVNSLLDSYGLSGLSQFAKDEIVAGRSASEITLDMTTQQAFKDRFPVIDILKQKGLPAWSPADIVNYEKQATTLLQSAGLPQGFYDSPQDFTNFIAGGVSLQELDQRVTNGYSAVQQMPQDVKDQWSALGYTTGDMVAHFLDPNVTEALLTKQLAATQRAAEAKRSGYGQLSADQAGNLAGMGISAQQSQQGFQQLVQQKELFNNLPGQAGNGTISGDQQLAAMFGNSVADQQAITKVANERVATFKGGGQYSQGQNGTTGVGTAV